MTVPQHETPPKQCAQGGCTASYTPHHWGSKAAERLGWFIQKNGDAWCPDHNPDWVAEWRKRRNQKEN